MLVQIMLVYYGLPMIGIEPPVPAFLGSAGNRVMYGIIALTINSGGYICEIIRSGIESVDPGQMEAARSIGFGPVRSMMMIVVPQAVKNILPNFGNEFTNLIQASSQVMVIGVAELMFTFNTISSNGRVFTPLIVLRDDVYRWTRRTCNGKALQKSGSVNQFNLLSLYLMIETHSQPFHIQKEDTHMKTTVKRTLSLLLAAASMASVLTACGSKDTAAADTSADTQAVSASADASDLGPVLTRIKESGEMVIATASGYMPYEFVDISSANQDVIGVDMALGDKLIEKLSDKLGVEVKKKVEDTTFTANLAAVAADQVDIMLAGMSPPLRNASRIWTSPMFI